MRIIFYLILITLTISNFSCTNNSVKFGKAGKIKGDVSIFTTKENKWNPVKKNDVIHFRDTIQTKDGSAEIIFNNKSKITLEPNSKILIIDSADGKIQFIFPIVFSGGILSEIKHRKSNDFTYIVYTPVAYAEARGSHYYVSYSPATGSTDVHVFDGNIVVYNVTNFSEPVQLSPGFSTTVTYYDVPKKPTKLTHDQFRRVGYMFTSEICEKYQIAFGLPVVPIPVPVPVVVPVSIPTPPQTATVQESEPYPQEEDYTEDYYEPVRKKPDNKSKSKVSVSVSVNAPIPIPVPLPGMPVPVPVPGHRHHSHHSPAPAAPPIIAPVPGVPVPAPGRSHKSHNRDNREMRNDEKHVSGHPPVPPAPIPPIPGGKHFPFKH